MVSDSEAVVASQRQSHHHVRRWIPSTTFYVLPLQLRETRQDRMRPKTHLYHQGEADGLREQSHVAILDSYFQR